MFSISKARQTSFATARNTVVNIRKIWKTLLSQSNSFLIRKTNPPRITWSNAFPLSFVLKYDCWQNSFFRSEAHAVFFAAANIDPRNWKWRRGGGGKEEEKREKEDVDIGGLFWQIAKGVGPTFQIRIWTGPRQLVPSRRKVKLLPSFIAVYLVFRNK